MSQKSSPEPSSTSLYLASRHAITHLVGDHHYCVQIIINIYLDQLIDIIFNIDMGIQDILGKEIIFAMRVSFTEIATINCSLFIAFVLRGAQVSRIDFEWCLDSNFDIIIVIILAVSSGHLCHCFVHIIIFILTDQI